MCISVSVNFLPRLSAFADTPPFLYRYDDLSHPFLPSGPLRLTRSTSPFSHFVIPPSDLPSLPHLRLHSTLPSTAPLSASNTPPAPPAPPARDPHLISLNLFPSLHIGTLPRCDLGDISTVTPVMLHRGKHCPPCVTQGTDVPLV